MGFSRQEYWSGLPFPSLGDLSDPGIKPGSPALRLTLYRLSHQGSPGYQLKASIYYLTVPKGQVSRCGFTGYLWPGVPHEVTVQLKPEVQPA